MVHGHLGCQSGLVIGLFVPRCTKYSSPIGCVPCTSASSSTCCFLAGC